MAQQNDLFSDFETLSDEAWREKVIKDLKGRDFEETLVWEDEVGLNHQPYYRKSDIENNKVVTGIQQAQKKNADWQTFQSFQQNTEDIEGKIKMAIANGVDQIVLDSKLNVSDEILQSDTLKIYFKDYPDLTKVSSFYIDPIGSYLKSGEKLAPFTSPLVEIFKAKQNTANDRFLLVDATVYKNAGANLVDELAFALQHAVEYFDLLTENGLAANEIANRMIFKLAFGGSYFNEIAKGRAFRYLLSKLFSAYELKQSAFVWGESNWSDLAHKDPYTNLLRTTTQSMSAVLANCDAISALSFDDLGASSNLGIRMARNIQLILKEESYFAKVSDMAAGSYYIESLSAQIADKAWQRFLEIEDKGGLLNYFESGSLQNDLNKSIQQRLEKMKAEKRKVVGVNAYENEAADQIKIQEQELKSKGGLKKFLLAKEIEK